MCRQGRQPCPNFCMCFGLEKTKKHIIKSCQTHAHADAQMHVHKSTRLYSQLLKVNWRESLRMCTQKAEESRVIVEGKAEILVPSSENVFYNSVQEFNRDLSVAVLTVLSEEKKQRCLMKQCKKEREVFSSTSKSSLPIQDCEKSSEDGLIILEALAATGLRSIRYAKEIPGIKQVIANDISDFAIKSIKENILHNNVADLVIPSQNDAIMVMYQHRQPLKRVDAVDIDPYGCPSTFLDAAVQCVVDGGMLLVTCTDMAVLAGNSPETCYVKYGSVSLRTKACHEMALRIVLQCIESHANRHGRYTVPVLSLSADFYIRVFVKIYSGAAMCKQTTSKLSLVYQCTGCETQTLQTLGVVQKLGEKVNQCKFSLPSAPPVGLTCEHCNHKFHIGGPIWSAPIHNEEFLSKLTELVKNGEYGTQRRMEGVLAVIREELPDVPLYYSLEKLCSTVRAETMPMIQFRSALMNGGYCVSMSHACKNSMKTNAPSSFVWDIVRTWVQTHPVKQERLSDTGQAILSKSPSAVVSTDIHPDANPSSRQMGLVRYQTNPRPFWGPGTRSKTHFQNEHKIEKSIKNQGKRSRSESTSPNTQKKNIKNDDNLRNESEQTMEVVEDTEK